MVSDHLQRYVDHHDAEAFHALVREYQEMVYGTCLRSLRNAGDAEEAVQETFVKLAARAREIRGNVGAWLHACARTSSSDVAKRWKAKRNREQPLAEASQATEQPAVGDACERNDEGSVVDACIHELPELDREVILSYFFIALSQDEIANRMGVSQAAIQKRLARALEILRGKFTRRGVSVAGAMLASFLGSLKAEAQVAPECAMRLTMIDPTAVGTAARSAASQASLAKILAIAVACLAAGVPALLYWLRPAGADLSWDFNDARVDGLHFSYSWRHLEHGGPDGSGCLEMSTTGSYIGFTVTRSQPLLITFKAKTAVTSEPDSYHYHIRFTLTPEVQTKDAVASEPKTDLDYGDHEWSDVAIYVSQKGWCIYRGTERLPGQKFMGHLGDGESTEMVMQVAQCIDDLRIRSIAAEDLPDDPNL